MDDSLSRIFPSNRIGHDGFYWWIGQIEGDANSEENNKGGYRYKVAIIGEHTKEKADLDTDELPWANVMMPVTTPFTPGAIGGSCPQLVKGCWVIGFYMDGDKQKPIIMGSIGQTPGATSTINNATPDGTDRFLTAIQTGNLAPIVEVDGVEGGIDNKQRQVVISNNTKDGDGNLRVDLGTRKFADLEREEWCQQVGELCEKDDLKSNFNYILGSFLRDVQRSNGNVGTYYVSKITGSVNDTVNVGRRYVNKAIAVLQKFIAKIKGYLVSLIQKAVNKLVKALLSPDPIGNGLTKFQKWADRILDNLGCTMADLLERLTEWLTNVLMSYISQLYRAAICQVDELVNGIISKIQQLLNQLLNDILGPLQDILGAIAEPFNMIGKAINYILNLLGISCTGPDKECATYKKLCTDGDKQKDEDDFLDRLLDKLDNLFPDTPSDYTQYVCDEAYTGNPLTVTTIGFTGGIPLPGTGTSENKIIYNIEDIEVKEGDLATFTVTRSGNVDQASSVNFKTLKNQGSATAGTDYLDTEGLLGFATGETSKTIEVQTLVDFESDSNEIFFIKLTNNTPADSIPIKFIKNIARCTIIETDLKEPHDPYKPEPTDPFKPIDITLPEDFSDPEDDTSSTGTSTLPSFAVTANRSTCPEDEFIIYTVSTENVENGSIFYYTLSGIGITASDIVGNSLTGAFVINDNTAKITVGIEEDGVVEDEETLTFSINTTDASVDVLIIAKDGSDIGDIGIGEGTETVYEDFKVPIVNTGDIITDDSGGIIDIPVANPGDAWAEAPYVFIGGQGSGATAIPLLDENGFLTEIRMQSSGFGYKKNLAKDNGVRCIIDSFTILKTGSNYSSVPDVYVNGKLGVAEAIINDDGFVIGARILDRETTFEELPSVDIIGGGGYGARVLASLACLDTDALANIGSTKIGTGRYVDCP
tara:strand:+ start:1156 stop:3948 length:2793 start_codon:yes stop_codon:yes gene_type:complete